MLAVSTELGACPLILPIKRPPFLRNAYLRIYVYARRSRTRAAAAAAEIVARGRAHIEKVDVDKNMHDS